MIETRRVAAMGGHATITLLGAPAGLLDHAVLRLDHYESIWSRFLPTSDLSRLGEAAGSTLVVDPATCALVLRMRELTELTAGDFDPTRLPDLVESGYARSRVHADRATTLAPDAAPGGDLDAIAVDVAASTVRLPRGMTLDSGGIGKGFAAELLVDELLAAGADGVMAEVGGDIVVGGRAPDGIAWGLGIEDPFDTSRHLAVVRLAAGALVTSSRAKRRWDVDGVEHHHLIDPRTGRSAATPVVTGSVIATGGARAEALAKCLFLRDVDSALDWLPSVGAAGFAVLADRSIRISSNWEDYR